MMRRAPSYGDAAGAALRQPGAGTDGAITSTQCDANCSTRSVDRARSRSLLLARARRAPATMLLLTSLFYYDITVPRAAMPGARARRRRAPPAGVQSANSLTSARAAPDTWPEAKRKRPRSRITAESARSSSSVHIHIVASLRSRTIALRLINSLILRQIFRCETESWNAAHCVATTIFE